MRRVIFVGIGSAGDVLPLWAIRDQFKHLHLETRTLDFSARCKEPSLRTALSSPGFEAMEIKFLDGVVVSYLAADCQVIREEVLKFRPDAIVANAFCWAARLVADALQIPIICASVSPGYWQTNITPRNRFKTLDWLNTLHEVHGKLRTGNTSNPGQVIDRFDLELRLFPDEMIMDRRITARPHSIDIGPCWDSSTVAGDEFWRWGHKQKQICLVTFGSWIAPEYKQSLAEVVTAVVLEDPTWSVLYLGDGQPAPRARLLSLDWMCLEIASSALSASVTHAGIGTLMQVLRWGDPTVCVPFCADQPYNAQWFHAASQIPTLDPQTITADSFRDAFAAKKGVAAKTLVIQNHAEHAAHRILDFLN